VTNSLSFMQRNLCHIWGDMMHYHPLPIQHLGGSDPTVPRGIYATVTTNTTVLSMQSCSVCPNRAKTLNQ